MSDSMTESLKSVRDFGFTGDCGEEGLVDDPSIIEFMCRKLLYKKHTDARETKDYSTVIKENYCVAGASSAFVSGDSPPHEDPFLPSTSSFLRDMFIFKENTDVVFGFKSSESITYFAHKLVLSLWSPYFAKKFYGTNSKQENIIILKNVDPGAFHFMLRSMYNDPPDIETCNEALEIFKAAVKFQVHILIKKSHSYVEDYKPEITNVFEVLEAAIHMKLTHKEEECMKLIQDNTSEVFEFCDTSKISSTIICKILDLQLLALESEYVLLEWIFQWAKNEYMSNDKCTSVRDVLKIFLPKLYFISLSSKEFARFYKNHKTFFDEEEALSILMNIVLPNSVPLPEWQESEFCPRTYFNH